MSSDESVILVESDSDDEIMTGVKKEIDSQLCSGRCDAIKFEGEIKQEIKDEEDQIDVKVDIGENSDVDPLKALPSKYGECQCTNEDDSKEDCKFCHDCKVEVKDEPDDRNVVFDVDRVKKEEEMDVDIKSEEEDEPADSNREYMDIELKSEDEDLDEDNIGVGMAIDLLDGNVDPPTRPTKGIVKTVDQELVQTNKKLKTGPIAITEDTPIEIADDLNQYLEPPTNIDNTQHQTPSATKKVLQPHETCCLIDKLSKNRFLTSPFWPREQIVSEGRPIINLESLDVTEALFKKYNWITGCVERSKLFCWPCLLFDENGGPWSRGVAPDHNVTHLIMASNKHQTSKEHRRPVMIMNEFIKKCAKGKNIKESDLNPQIGKTILITKPPARVGFAQQLEPVPGTSQLQRVLGVPGPVTVPSTQRKIIPSVSKAASNTPQPKVVDSTSKISPAEDSSLNCDISSDSEHGVSMTIPSPPRVGSVSPERIKEAQKMAEQNYVPLDGDVDIVKLLVEKNFVKGTWAKGEQDLIVFKGRKCPSMLDVLGNTAGSSESALCDALYYKYQWLTGSETLQKLYCWPCLLYSPEASALDTSTGDKSVYDNHEVESSHLEASLCLKLLEHDISSRRTKKERCKETITAKNRDFLRHLIDVVCTVKTHINNADPSDEDYVDLLKLISCYNMSLESYLLEVSQETGKDAATSLVASFAEPTRGIIKKFMQERIRSELLNTPCVSILLDDVKGLLNKSWISVMIRYADSDGTVHERFIKFIEIGYDRTNATIFPKVSATIKELGCGNKLVGFTYDGAVIDPPGISAFNFNIKREYPSAMFFHNQNHNLKTLLQQALSHLRECRNFFRHLEPLRNFFINTPNAMAAAVKISGAGENESWDFTVDFITTIKDHYKAVLSLFESINTSPNGWDIESVVQAPYYLNFLRNLQNRFLFVFLARVFTIVNPLTVALQGDFDSKLWVARGQAAKLGLHNLKNTGLDEICRAACNDDLQPDNQTGESQRANNLKSINKDIFDTLIDCASDFIEARLETTEKWKFFDCDFMQSIIDKNRNCSKEIVYSLNSILYPASPLFNITKLMSQLDFHYNHQVFKEVTNINGLVKAINDYEMTSTMSELHRYLRFLLTVPVSSPVVVKTKFYDKLTLYVKHNIKNLNSTNAFMWMEKDMLASMQQGGNFNDLIITQLNKMKTPNSALGNK